MIWILMKIYYAQCGILPFIAYLFWVYREIRLGESHLLIPSILRLILCAVALNCAWWT